MNKPFIFLLLLVGASKCVDLVEAEIAADVVVSKDIVWKKREDLSFLRSTHVYFYPKRVCVWKRDNRYLHIVEPKHWNDVGGSFWHSVGYDKGIQMKCFLAHYTREHIK